MRCLYLTLCLAMAIVPACSQNSVQLSADDKREIKAEAKKIIETHFSDLMNSIASDGIGAQGRRLILVNSFLVSENQIFDPSAIIEDDTNPEYTTAKKGPDMKVQPYLEKFETVYAKSEENSVKISEVNVTDVKQGKEYPYVQVHFKIQFLNKHRNKPDLKYAAIIRTAEFRAEKPEKEWKVLMTGIRYYKAPTTEQPVAQNNAPAKQAKLSQTGPPKTDEKVAQKPKAKETEAPKTTANQVVKTEQPPISKTSENSQNTPVVAKKIDTEVVKAAEKSPEMVPSNSSKQAPAVVNANMQELEAKAAKYKKQTNLFRAGAGAAVVGAVATYFVVNGAYSDYKSKLNQRNVELEQWWSASENGKNFGNIEDYKTKPKSMIEFGSPGIYFVGAGVVAGGVLWFLSSGSNKQAKEYKKLMEQKRKQLSITPQLSGPQRYAGLHIRYQF